MQYNFIHSNIPSYTAMPSCLHILQYTFASYTAILLFFIQSNATLQWTSIQIWNTTCCFHLRPRCWSRSRSESFIGVLTETNVYVSKVVQEDVNILGNVCKEKLEWMGNVLTFFILLQLRSNKLLPHACCVGQKLVLGIISH